MDIATHTHPSENQARSIEQQGTAAVHGDKAVAEKLRGELNKLSPAEFTKLAKQIERDSDNPNMDRYDRSQLTRDAHGNVTGIVFQAPYTNRDHSDPGGHDVKIDNAAALAKSHAELQSEKDGEKVARNKDSSPAALAHLAGDKSDSVRRDVAANEHTSADVLQRLASDPAASVRENVAHNKNTPPEVLAKLAKDSDPSVVHSLINREHLPADILAKVAANTNSFVRSDLAQYSYNQTLLSMLAKDSDSQVRANVAASSFTSVSTLNRLAHDNDFYVRENVAQNKKTPPELLAKLASDHYSMVRDAAAHNSSTPAAAKNEARFLHFVSIPGFE